MAHVDTLALHFLWHRMGYLGHSVSISSSFITGMSPFCASFEWICFTRLAIGNAARKASAPVREACALCGVLLASRPLKSCHVPLVGQWVSLGLGVSHRSCVGRVEFFSRINLSSGAVTESSEFSRNIGIACMASLTDASVLLCREVGTSVHMGCVPVPPSPFGVGLLLLHRGPNS